MTVEMSGTVDVLRKAEGMENGLEFDCFRIRRYISVDIKVSHHKKLATRHYKKLQNVRQVRNKLSFAAFGKLRRRAVDDNEANGDTVNA